jgi:hypothetical protein
MGNVKKPGAASKKGGSLSTNPHSVRRREQAAKMPQWRAELEKSLSYHRGRRAYYKKREEAGTITEEVHAARNLNSERTLCDEFKQILNAVPVAERDGSWREKVAWEKDRRA